MARHATSRICAALLVMLCVRGVRADASDDLADADIVEGAEAPGLGESEAPELTEVEASGTGDAEAPADADPKTAMAPEAEAPAIRVRVSAGAGLGTRAFEKPTKLGAQRLDETWFAAADVTLGVHIWPEESFSLRALLRYQSSLGLSVETHPQFALANEVDTRVERGELSVAPTIRLGEGAEGMLLSFPVGASFRTFWPEVPDLGVEGHSLFGPHGRAELHLPITPELGLRIGPEVQWIVVINRRLRDAGLLSQGLALGAEALLQLRLVEVWAVELSYRESHAWVHHGSTGTDLMDRERFVTARIAGEF